MSNMLKSTDGVQLYTRNYLVPNPIASVLIVHGLGEHSQRYQHVAKAFNEAGINVYTFDLRGHGQSSGERVYINSIDEFRHDVENVYRSIPKDIPFFILGHSMGGLIVTDFVLFNERNDVRGVVLSGPALEVGEEIGPLQQGAIRLISRFAPKMKTVKLKSKNISRDPAVVAAYENDPLVYQDGGKAGFGVALLDAIKHTKTRFAEFDYPVLIMHGSDDKLTNPHGSKNLYKQARSTDKTLKIWDGYFHEIFNEIDNEPVIQQAVDWVKKRV